MNGLHSDFKSLRGYLKFQIVQLIRVFTLLPCNFRQFLGHSLTYSSSSSTGTKLRGWMRKTAIYYRGLPCKVKCRCK